MGNQRLYIVRGAGNDTVGLVGKITAPIAKMKGNIVDLRQDVLHGLFTLYMVVDLTDTDLRIEDFTKMINEIAEDTDLKLSVDKYTPVPRSPEKKNLLMILIGSDKPGIIAASSEMLGKYKANIEFAKTIGREGIFLMELLTDISRCSLPLDNLTQTLKENMDSLNIKTIFQADDVFNKKKSVILFKIRSSFINGSTISDIIHQTKIKNQELSSAYSDSREADSLKKAISKLDRFPSEVIDRLLGEFSATSGSVELLQTLKIMGYKIALVSNGFTFFTDHLMEKLGLDYCFGVKTKFDDDTRTLSGDLLPDSLDNLNIDAVISRIAEIESIDERDITIITDEDFAETPGVRLNFDTGVLLDCFNKHIITQDNLIGILGSFGIPKL